MAGLFSVIIPAELHKQFYPRGSYILQAHAPAQAGSGSSRIFLSVL